MYKITQALMPGRSLQSNKYWGWCPRFLNL